MRLNLFIWSLALLAISAELVKVSFDSFNGFPLWLLNMDFEENQPATAKNNVQASENHQDNDVQSAVPQERERRFFTATYFRNVRRLMRKCRLEGYKKGRSAGYKKGLSVGRSSGYKSGYARGRSSGFAAGTAAEKRKLSTKISSAYNRGYQLGYANGYRNGKRVGYKSGYKVGKRTGYRSGHSVGYRKGKEARCSYTTGVYKTHLLGYPKSLGRKLYT